jgi:DNA polymerase-1
LTKDLNPDALIRTYAGIDIARQDANELFAESDPSLDAWVFAVLTKLATLQLETEGSLGVYRDIELPASVALAQMEQLGISIDRANLEQQFDELTQEVDVVAKEAYAIIGHEVNLASPKQLQTVLFEELGMQGTRSVKTGFSTNAEALATLYEQTEHPFLERLLAHRDATKLRQMAETLIKAIEPDGRIHTTYSQVGTATGRLSSENPNLQNIPIKTARGQKLRSAFIAGQGFETLLTADYSQIEMRIMAHLSQDQGLIEAFNQGEDLHSFVGARIYGVEPSEVTSQMRSKVKAMSYGLVYGLSEYGLARQLRIESKEAKQLMADYFARFGGVKTYLDQVVQKAKNLGYTTTVYGRRRPFPDLNSKVFQLREIARRAALNAPIQGTAADIMKLAMIKVHESMVAAGLKSQMLLQVHDELVFAVAPGELETLKQLTINAMRNGVCALTGLTGRERDNHEVARQLSISLGSSSVRVGRALGLALEPVGGLELDVLARAQDDAAALQTITQMIMEVANARSDAQRPSMAQDIRKGRRTEIDDINGLVARRGVEVGIDVTYHQRITQVMKRVERGELAPSPDLLHEIVR